MPLSAARLATLLQRAESLQRLADYGIGARDIEAGINLTIVAERSGVVDPALDWQRQFAQIAAAAGVSL